jgi:F-type H+-transporting ATPase subunit b
MRHYPLSLLMVALAPAVSLAAGGGDIDIFAPRFDLGIWTIVVFLGLVFILKKYAWGPMIEGLRKREENVRGALEEAKKAKADAQRIQAELKQQMDGAAQKIAGMMEEGRRDAQQLLADAKAQAAKDIQTERERLRRDIDTARDQALQELLHRTPQLAVLIAGKVIRKQLTIDDQQKLVDEALQELKTAGKQRNGAAN